MIAIAMSFFDTYSITRTAASIKLASGGQRPHMRGGAFSRFAAAPRRGEPIKGDPTVLMYSLRVLGLNKSFGSPEPFFKRVLAAGGNIE